MTSETMSRDPGAAGAETSFEPGVEGFSFADLFEAEKLRDLSERFDRELAAADPPLFESWSTYRTAPDAESDPRRVSDLLIRVSEHVSAFVSRLFRIEEVRDRRGKA
ncbi:MAG: hypothetical protein LAO51_20350, partial [Acidobacteriia bacterium]|nr:hypothetical protein [Terriglobia bacterium]